MPVLEYSGGKIVLDDEGYLENPDDWNDKVACALAEKEGIEELTRITSYNVCYTKLLRCHSHYAVHGRIPAQQSGEYRRTPDQRQ